MRRIIKIFLWILLSLFSILSITIVALYRKDISQEELEDIYFTSRSHYFEATISDLEGQTLSLTIHYQDYGNESDDVIILLHGAFASSHTFIPWANRLVESGFRVLLIDLPYHGLSDGFTDQVTSLRRSAAVIKELLEHLLIDRVTIGGNSMGGGVSWYFVGTYSDDIIIDGLILIDAIYPSLRSGRPNGISRFLAKDPLASLVSKLTPRFLFKNILQGVYGSANEIDDETIDRYYDLIRREGHRKSILINTQEVFTQDEGLALLDGIRLSGIPILLMWGKEDTWIPVDVADLFIERLSLDDHQVIIYEGIGHVPMEEDPELTVLDLIHFLVP